VDREPARERRESAFNCCGLTRARGRRTRALRPSILSTAAHAEAPGEPRGLSACRSTTLDVRGGEAALGESADQRGRHVAAAEEADFHRSNHVHPSRAVRAPKIAVPTRTIVAPSAIASSRSSDNAHRQRIEREARIAQFRRAGGAAPRSATGSSALDSRRLRESPSARAAGRRGSTAIRSASPRTSSGATPALALLAATFTWMQTFSGGRSSGRCIGQPFGELQPIDGMHPSRNRRRQSPRLVACSGPMKCHSSPSARSSAILAMLSWT